ncbi:MAG: glycosyltransferase family 39 protein [bacterium]|nr:glycosyltransferase family 39 protein [bacterium]
MVAFAIVLGVYSYLILALGLLGWFYKLPVFLLSLPFLAGGVFWLIGHFNQLSRTKIWMGQIQKDKLVVISLVILLLQVFVNFLGAISPELSFDALWYHLTSAKLYAANHAIFYIPGELLWPANTPRLADMFYTAALLFSNEILAKLIHFSFGILSAIALFNLLRRYFSLRLSILGVLTFYTMLIVGWQSTTAYVELVRTFFEILALDLFLKWVKEKKDIDLFEAGVLCGLAIATKMLAFTTFFVFLVLIYFLKQKGWLVRSFKFLGFTILAVFPWLVLSFVHTGNPLFPVFGNFRDPIGAFSTGRYDLPIITNFALGPFQLWPATFTPDSIISVVYLLFLPLVLISIWKQRLEIKVAAIYVFLAIQLSLTFSNRYLLPYLPGLTLITLSVFNWDFIKKKNVEKILIGVIIFSALLNFGSRTLATKKFLPYLLGKESKSAFLSRNLNFDFGDFYDTDGYFAKNIKKDDLVLVYGIHNLYYLNFPFMMESWAHKGTYFTHILVGNNQELPERFGQKLLLYKNYQTGVKLYLFGDKI